MVVSIDILQVEHFIKPLSTFLVPIFFVMRGIRIRRETLANLPISGRAAGLTLAAIIEKQIYGLGESWIESTEYRE